MSLFAKLDNNNADALHCPQSLLLAPLFVWFEVLFALGYRKDLYRELQVGGCWAQEKVFSLPAFKNRLLRGCICTSVPVSLHCL